MVSDRILSLLASLYGQPAADAAWARIRLRLESASKETPSPSSQASPLSEKDAILITYGDTFSRPDQPPLQTLAQFMDRWLQDAVSGLHILPFYPYSSDDGFSVIDYRQVDPRLGTWEDIAHLGQRCRLMFDGVINHVSQYSQWFQAYLRQEAPYRDYFITAHPEWDLSGVVRPRTLPLLTDFETKTGLHKVWTTFSADQVDLNYANPHVLIEIIDLLLYYVQRGAGIIRLDAIAYLWKEPGTGCIHLPQTHIVIKILRAVLDLVAPHVILISETNVPHGENISYFGVRDPATRRTDEAQLVYQFPLAPLILHSFAAQDARRLCEWAGTLDAPGIFFNFIASHDGIGVQPVHDLLTAAEVQRLVERTLAHGGMISCKSDASGQQIPYELNITLFDALNNPAHPEPHDVQRFLAAQVIMLSLAGVPGIYVHSLFGSRNCTPCVQDSGRARSINREKFDYPKLQAELEQGQSQRARILTAYQRLLLIRRQQPAFHPAGGQKVLCCNPSIFSILRFDTAGERPVVCMVNVSDARSACRLNLRNLNLPDYLNWQDLISSEIHHPISSYLEITLAPYQSCWLTPCSNHHNTSAH